MFRSIDSINRSGLCIHWSHAPRLYVPARKNKCSGKRSYIIWLGLARLGGIILHWIEQNVKIDAAAYHLEMKSDSESFDSVARIVVAVILKHSDCSFRVFHYVENGYWLWKQKREIARDLTARIVGSCRFSVFFYCSPYVCNQLKWTTIKQQNDNIAAAHIFPSQYARPGFVWRCWLIGLCYKESDWLHLFLERDTWRPNLLFVCATKSAFCCFCSSVTIRICSRHLVIDCE